MRSNGLIMTTTSENPETTIPDRGDGRHTSHPIFAVPIDEEVHTRNRGLDKVVFGVPALIAIGFLIWGFLSTSTLASASLTTK